MALLQLENLSVVYRAPVTMFRRRPAHVVAACNVTFSVEAGETVALVGESGAGKSSVARAALRLIPADSGRVMLGGEDITHLEGEPLRRRRRDMQIILQDANAALPPWATVREMLDEAMDAHAIATNEVERNARINELLSSFGLAEDLKSRRPAELSGGQRRRAALARAFAVRPKLLVLDESVSSLDAPAQVQLIELLRREQRTSNLGYLLISHDLGVVRALSHRIVVMQRGEVVEQGATAEVLGSPVHPFTRRLVAATPRLGQRIPARKFHAPAASP